MRTIVVGGGVIGLSVADALLRRRSGEVILLEREAALGSGASGRNPGAIRSGFDSPLNTSLTLASLPLLDELAARSGIAVGFARHGYLWLASTPDQERSLQRAVRQLVERGGSADWLEPRGVAHLVPSLDTARLRGAAYFRMDGYLDPHALVAAYQRSALQAGLTIRLGEPVSALAPAGDGTWAAVTSGGRYEGDVIVVAAGAWSRALLAPLGTELLIEPYRRHSFVSGPLDWAPGPMPFIVDAQTGAYFRRLDRSVMFGRGREYEADAPSLSLDVAVGALERAHAAASLVMPAMARASVRFGIAGPYQMTPDLHAIVGPVPALPGLYLACGFSGHGLMHAPITGRLVADWIVDGRPTSLPAAGALVLERFARGEALVEAMQV